MKKLKLSLVLAAVLALGLVGTALASWSFSGYTSVNELMGPTTPSVGSMQWSGTADSSRISGNYRYTISDGRPVQNMGTQITVQCYLWSGEQTLISSNNGNAKSVTGTFVAEHSCGREPAVVNYYVNGEIQGRVWGWNRIAGWTYSKH